MSVVVVDKKTFLPIVAVILILILILGTVDLAGYLQEQNAQIYGAGIAGRTPCTVLVFKYGSTYYAQGCQNLAIISSGASAATVMNAAVASMTQGGILHVMNGTYQLSSKVTSSLSNIILEGEGSGTVFTLIPSFGPDYVFYLTGSNWILRDFKLNAGNQINSHNYAAIEVTGSNDTETGLFVYSGDHCAIRSDGNNNIMTNNVVTNGRDDELCSVGNTGTIIDGNVIDTTTLHNGVSLSTSSNVTISNNLIKGTYYGIALENLGGTGSGPCKYVTITGNVIRGTFYDGINIYTQASSVDSGDYVTISGNTITNTGASGILLNSGHDLILADNVISATATDGVGIVGVVSFATLIGNTITPGTVGVSLANGASNIIMTSNFIRNPTYGILQAASGYNLTISNNEIHYPSLNGIDIDGGKDINIIGNTVRILSSNRGVYLAGVTRFHILDNQIIGSGSTSTTNRINAGILVRDTSSFGIISGNTVLGNAVVGINLYNVIVNTTVTNNIVTTVTTGIQEGTGATDFNIISGNILNACSSATLSFIGNHTLVMGNKGKNPFGPIANFVYSGGAGAGDGTYISPIGTSSTLTASTTYTITTAPCRVIFETTGTGISLVINGGTGFAVTLGESFTLYPGETINFGAFSVAPTLQVSFM